MTVETEIEKEEVVVEEEVVEQQEEEVVEGEQEVVEETEEEETPLFLAVEEDADEGEEGDSEKVPLPVLLKQKARRKEVEKENEELRARIEAYEKSMPQQATQELKTPNELDFDDPAEYQKALNEYHTNITVKTLQTQEQTRRMQEEAQRIQREREEAVNAHYVRAEEMLKKHSISPDIYRDSEKKVRDSVEVVMPGQGENVTDSLISIVGEDSEKAMLYLGRNKGALAEFTMLLQKDKTGLKAAAYLGKIAGKVNSNTVKKPSQAPKPAPKVEGENGSVSSAALLNKYNKAHKDKNYSLAYDIKKEARGLGIDTEKW